MQLKNIISVCVLALAGVQAADRTQSAQYCYNKKGMFLEARSDPSDSRFACLLPKKNGDEKTKYCVTYDGFSGCYAANYGNINYCKVNTKDYNGRGCALGLGYLYDSIKADDNKHESSRIACYKVNGSMFLEGTMDSPIDKRFACLLPKKKNDEKTKYCVTYDNKSVCYAPEYGNIAYCDLKDKNYHGRGCALGLGYLYDALKAEDKRHASSKTACKNKKGIFFDNPNDRSDRRFACLLPGNSSNKYCATFDGKSGCYAKEYGNMPFCDMSSPEYNSRGCMLGLGYLYNMGRMYV